MFGEDAKTIIAFNGESNQKGYHRLETASFDDETKTVQFRYIEFPRQGKNDVYVSGPNPAECQNCHAAGPHYIWNSYSDWPGVFGSADDIVGSGYDQGENLSLFRQETSSDPRYGALVFPQIDDNPATPYRPSHDGKNAGDGFYRPIEYRPNARLTMLVSRLQSVAILAKMQSSPQFAASRIGMTTIDSLIRALPPGITICTMRAQSQLLNSE